MTATRKARVPMAEQIRLINECRQSGMTDADWCRENGIAISTFYNWVSRCRMCVQAVESRIGTVMNLLDRISTKIVPSIRPKRVINGLLRLRKTFLQHLSQYFERDR